MAETTARQLLISALIFTALLTGSFIWIGNFTNTDTDASAFAGYNTSYSKFTEVKNQSDTIQNVIQGASPQSGDLGILEGLISASWGSLKLIWTSLGTMGTILSDISDSFGVPVWFTGMIIAIIGITITFALIAAWFKWYI